MSEKQVIDRVSSRKDVAVIDQLTEVIACMTKSGDHEAITSG